MEQSIDRSENIIGRIIVVSLLAYILVHFNYEISQYLMSRWPAWWDVRTKFFSDMERAGDEAGILGSLIRLILWIVLGLISALLFLVIAGAVWIVGKLNELYVLPFVLAVLVVYSKFSYAFIVRPFGGMVRAILGVLLWFVRVLARMGETFILLPLAEVISGNRSPAYRLYRVATSVLFIVGAACILLGTGGVAVHYTNKYRLTAMVESLVRKAAGSAGTSHFSQEQYQIEVKADHPHWTSTDIIINRGDKFSITARGQGTFMYPANEPGRLRPACCAPEGLRNVVGAGAYMLPSRFTRDYWQRGYSPNNFILPDEPLFGLIGTVGTGHAFYVGSFLEDRAEFDGKLALGVNQLWGDASCWSANSGAFQVTVVVKRR